MTEFSDLIKKGGQDSTALVTNSLHKSANGYEYEETHTEIQKGKDGQKTIVKKIKRYVPPNVGAIIFILCNRGEGKWRNPQQQINHSGEIAMTGVMPIERPCESSSDFQKECDKEKIKAESIKA